MSTDASDTAAAATALLVLVTGHPASGKSTIAARLSRRLRLSVLAKDDVQEALFDAGIVTSARARTAANHALLRIAGRLLAAGQDCIVDSNLDPSRWRQPVAALLARTGAGLLQVRCHADGALLLARFAARVGSRHPGHQDGERLRELRERLQGPPLAPLDLPGPVLGIDTGRDGDAAAEALVETVARLLMEHRAGAAARPAREPLAEG